MYNQTKKASNERYLSKFKTVSLRLPLDDAERLGDAASAAGVSLHSYLMACIMRHDADTETAPQDHAAPGGYVLAAGVLDLATAAAEADDKTLDEWLEKAVTAQAAADKRGRALADQVRELQQRQQQRDK